jgi:hypothetical protein
LCLRDDARQREMQSGNPTYVSGPLAI